MSHQVEELRVHQAVKKFVKDGGRIIKIPSVEPEWIPRRIYGSDGHSTHEGCTWVGLGR